MELQFFNTMNRRVEPFRSINPGEVRMYTCGPTVYNYAHIGNFRAYMFEDLLRRTLEFFGYRVRQVMNLTDVDDKTIRDSRAAGIPLRDFTQKYKQAFFEDLKTLNIEPAEVYPAATDHIPQMIRLISILMEKGFGYRAEDGSVYFSIEKFPDYGKLAKIDRENQRSGVRIKNDEYAKDSVALEGVGRTRRRRRLGFPVGQGTSRLAHRMQRNVERISRRLLRYPHRRHRQYVPASRR